MFYSAKSRVQHATAVAKSRECGIMCHPERCQESRLHGKEIPFGPDQGGLRSVQNDNAVDFTKALLEPLICALLPRPLVEDGTCVLGQGASRYDLDLVHLDPAGSLDSSAQSVGERCTVR